MKNQLNLLSKYGKKIYKQEFLNTFNNVDKIFDIASLKSLIEQAFGESNALYFKETFIREDHIAKLIVAMANSARGSIIFGVNDDNQQNLSVLPFHFYFVQGLRPER